MLPRFRKTLTLLENKICKGNPRLDSTNSLRYNSKLYGQITNNTICNKIHNSDDEKWALFVAHNLCWHLMIYYHNVGFTFEDLKYSYSQPYNMLMIAHFNNSQPIKNMMQNFQSLSVCYEIQKQINNYEMFRKLNIAYNLELLHLYASNDKDIQMRLHAINNYKQRFINAHLVKPVPLYNYHYGCTPTSFEPIENIIDCKYDVYTMDRMQFYFENYDEYCKILEKM